jgi:PIN domain nuclease of toxin-antitoxin system
VILLDTHALLWLAGNPDHLSQPARVALSAESELGLATISIQEIAYLSARGRLGMDRPVGTWIGDALAAHDVRVIAPTVATALRAGSLDPVAFHGDPIDRLIFATAVEHDLRLVSADTRLREADPTRVVW